MAKGIKYTRTWVSTANPSQGGLNFEPEPSSGKGGCLPPAVLRKIAMKSKDGGRAICHYCGKGFAAYFMKLCKIAAFDQDHVCADCRREHPEARPIR